MFDKLLNPRRRPDVRRTNQYYRLSLPAEAACVEKRTAAWCVYALFMSVHFRPSGRSNWDRKARRSIGIRANGCV